MIDGRIRLRLIAKSRLISPRNKGFSCPRVNYWSVRFLTLQKIEYQAEEQMAKDRLTSTPKEILARQGFCIDEVAGTWIKKSITGFNTASFARTGKGNKKFMWNKLT